MDADNLAIGVVYDGHPAISIDGSGVYTCTYCNVGGFNPSAVMQGRGQLS
jgi:hypothetical protein